MEAGDIEWMQAGGGVWHWGRPERGTIRGYQLWVAFPAELELAPAESRYLTASEVQSDGVARILLGSYGAMRSPIALPVPITYMHVRLKAGERWSYEPAGDHTSAWLAVHSGKLGVSGTVLANEMAIFEEGNGVIGIHAEGEAEFVIGSAAKHPHPLVCGSYSVHTSQATLMQGEAGIAALGRTPEVLAVRRRG